MSIPIQRERGTSFAESVFFAVAEYRGLPEFFRVGVRYFIYFVTQKKEILLAITCVKEE